MTNKTRGAIIRYKNGEVTSIEGLLPYDTAEVVDGLVFVGENFVVSHSELSSIDFFEKEKSDENDSAEVASLKKRIHELEDQKVSDQALINQLQTALAAERALKWNQTPPAYGRPYTVTNNFTSGNQGVEDVKG